MSDYQSRASSDTVEDDDEEVGISIPGLDQFLDETDNDPEVVQAKEELRRLHVEGRARTTKRALVGNFSADLLSIALPKKRNPLLRKAKRRF